MKMQASKPFAPLSKPLLFLGANPHRSRKMLQSYKGLLARIDENSSQVESSTSESSSQASSSTCTLTFKMGEKQQTFWYIKPCQSKLSKMAAIQQCHMKMLRSSSSSTFKADFLKQKVTDFQDLVENQDSQIIGSATEQPLSCCSLDFSMERELTQQNSCLSIPATSYKLIGKDQIKQQVKSCFDSFGDCLTGRSTTALSVSLRRKFWTLMDKSIRLVFSRPYYEALSDLITAYEISSAQIQNQYRQEYQAIEQRRETIRLLSRFRERKRKADKQNKN